MAEPRRFSFVICTNIDWQELGVFSSSLTIESARAGVCASLSHRFGCRIIHSCSVEGRWFFFSMAWGELITEICLLIAMPNRGLHSRVQCNFVCLPSPFQSWRLLTPNPNQPVTNHRQPRTVFTHHLSDPMPTSKENIDNRFVADFYSNIFLNRSK